MKNLINLGVEKLEDVPIEHLSHRPTQARKADWFRNNRCYRHKGYYKLGYVSPYDLIARIIKNNIGKPFDMAFSYYCKLVPQMYQKKFLERFECKRNWEPSHIVDNKGNIQFNPKNPWKGEYKRRINESKGSFSFKSDDYETELRHKITGHKQSDFKKVYKQVYYETRWKGRYKYIINRGYKDGKFLYYEYGVNDSKLKPLYLRYKAQSSDFEAVIIKGWEKVFETKNDPEYQRLKAERRKKKSISLKKERIIKAEKAYDMIFKTELKKKEEALLNKQNILRHGFDPVSSFRGVQPHFLDNMNGCFKTIN